MSIDDSKQQDDGDEPPRAPVPRVRVWRQAITAASAPFANPARTPVMLAALDPLLADHALVRFSNHTGLVRTLRGPLWPTESAESPKQARTISEAFLQRYQQALFGTLEERWREAPVPISGSTVCWRQVDAAGVPIYGAQVALDFDNDGWLRMVVANWYPLAHDQVHTFALPSDEAGAMAIVAVREDEERQRQALDEQLDDPDDPRLASKPGELVAQPGDELAHGQLIMPLYDRPGQYRAAWAFNVLDEQYGRSWQVIVNAEDDRPRILSVARCFNELPVAVFASSGEAILGSPSLSVALADIIAAFPGGVPQPTGGDQNLENVSYHLGRAATLFDASARHAWAGPSAQLNALPGLAGGNHITLNLSPPDQRSRYDHITRTLSIGRNSALGRSHALDCEVVYHEYSHALFDTLQHGLVDATQPGNFRGSINEGLAFYLACALSERSPADTKPQVWADFAYNSASDFDLGRQTGQQANFDFLTEYGVFPVYPGAALGSLFADLNHAAGMLFARALWDVHQILGYELADSAILRAMSLLGGIHTEFETAAETIMYAADLLLGGSAPPGTSSIEQALQLAFNSRGITADGPVNDLQSVTVGGTTLTLAAIENASGQQGCLCSPNGVSWQPLGSDGPAEVLALAVVNLTPTHAALLAVGVEPGKQATTVFRYDLQSGPAFNLTAAWTLVGAPGELEGKLGNAGILCIAGAATGGALQIFVGSEQGLFQHDGATWAALSLPAPLPAQPIFSLAPVSFLGKLLLFVGAHDTLVVLEPGATGQPAVRLPQYEGGARPFQPTLALAAAATVTGVTAWAATSGGLIYRYDGTTWAAASELVDHSPIYSLVVDPSQSDPDAIVVGSKGNIWRLASSPGAVASLNAGFSGLAVVALGRTPAGLLLAGTLERGLWRQKTDGSWQPVTGGLSRVGRMVDATAPTVGAWVRTFSRTRTLGKDAVASHVVYLPADRARMELQDSGGTLGPGDKLELLYAPPILDLSGAQPAGLVRVASGPVTNPKAGYYIIRVVATQPIASYVLRISLT